MINTLGGKTGSKPYKRRILVVEDEEDAANVFKTLIETGGNFEVDIALDGKKALDMQRIGRYDLVLLDIIMPIMDGIETLKVLKENPEVYGTPIVLMLTNLTGEMAEESVKKYKADGYIVKIDTEPEKLLQKIKDALPEKVESQLGKTATAVTPVKPAG